MKISSLKLVEVAQKLACRLEGDPAAEITGVAGLEYAAPGQLTFLANRKYFPLLRTTQASAVLVEEGVALKRDAGLPPLAALRTANPYLAFAHAIDLFYQPPRYAPGIHPTAVVAANARIGAAAHIGPYCYVDDDAVIGKNAVLHSFVTIYRGAQIGDDFFAHSQVVVREFCRLGHRVILQNGAVIGGDGFGYARQADGTWYKMAQAGPAVLEDDVEVQANSCVDRATIGETRIGRGSKLDDLVVVGHASHLGQNVMLCGHVGLAGSTKVGNDCILAGRVGSAGHLTIGDGTIVTAQSGVPHAQPPAGTAAPRARTGRAGARNTRPPPLRDTAFRNLTLGWFSARLWSCRFRAAAPPADRAGAGPAEGPQRARREQSH
jgi:UDP-3-O-[3-hydroxymyristoyl] glucosamine N-acyltransferase